MSNNKECNKCGFNNTPGSKFCNNCGNKLPLGTHIICPNCETNNAIDRVFCDNCGTRLIEDAPLPEDPEQEDPTKSAGKSFSLPTRRPGDTGELDPNTALPEWLKTGNTDRFGQSGDGDGEGLFDDDIDIDIGDGKPLHKLEELTADKSLTDDLPDWLVKNSDSNPLFDAPDAISTELYMDLVDKSDDFGKEDLPFDTSDTNLPDWLAEAGKFEDTSISPSETETGKLSPPSGEEEEGDDTKADSESEGSGLTKLFSDMAVDENPSEQESALPDSDISGLTALFSEELINDESDESSQTPSESDIDGFTALFEDSEFDQADELEPTSDEADLARLTALFADPDDDESTDVAPSESPDLADEISQNLAGEQEDVSVDFAELFQAEEGADEDDLPDWMANLAASDDPLIISDGDKLDDDLFSLEDDTAQSEMDWLMQTGGFTVTDEAEGLDIPAELEDQLSDDDASGDDLDWLSELASVDTNLLDQSDEDVLQALDAADEKDVVADDLLDSLLDDDEEEPKSELPLTGKLDGVPAALAGEELPDWLDSGEHFHTEVEEGETAVSPEPASESSLPDKGFTDWLQFSDELEDGKLAAEAERELSENKEILDEWEGLLEETEASTDTTQTELPDWIDDLRPDEQVDPLELTSAIDESVPAETKGPLAGLRGVIDLSPVVKLLHPETEMPSFMVTPEQQQQLDLLRQLSHDDSKSDTTDASVQSTEALTRIFLVVLLLAAVLAGLLLPGILPAPVFLEQSGTVDAVTAVNEAAGKTVLVAFDYTPALAGELAPQSQLLLDHLAQNGSDIVVVSQYTAGIALATTHLLEEDNGTLLGYLPGEAVGLRHLSGCLNQSAEACTTISTWTGEDNVEALLADVSMILLITGQRDSLIHWVEQVGATTDIPVVAGVTQALEPVAAPYYASGQLDGLIAGTPSTAVYNSLANNDEEVTELLSKQILSQTMGQIMIVAVFIIGLFVYGIIYPLTKKK